MQRILTIVGLQAYAVLLALYQGLSSVRTDEAKYLLDIPYPHPPLMRSVMEATEFLEFQEMFWRVLLATLLVQAVWLLVRMSTGFSPEQRLTICGLWIFASSIIFQSGTIMMAPITALQGLVFVWLWLNTEDQKSYAGWIALFWLASLFTAYQAVLFGPLVLAIFWRMRLPFVQTILAVGVPIALTVLYVSTNPLAAASFLNAGGQNTHMALVDTLQMVLGSWLTSGSVVLSIAGVVGIVRSKNYALLGSIALVFLFLMTSFRGYYAILFLPLLIGGVIAYPAVLKKSASLLALQIVVSVWMFAHASLAFYPSPARTVMTMVNQLQSEGIVLISGSFGHEWQYESEGTVMRYTPSLLSKAKAVVCLDACPGVSGYGFYQIENTAQEVWVRSSR